MNINGIPGDIWESFHKTWTWAVGRPGYDKQKFLELETHLTEIGYKQKHETDGQEIHWLICVEEKPAIELEGTVVDLRQEDSGVALVADVDATATIPDDGCFFVRLQSSDESLHHTTLKSLDNQRVKISISLQ
jgi:hypothetical protein